MDLSQSRLDHGSFIKLLTSHLKSFGVSLLSNRDPAQSAASKESTISCLQMLKSSIYGKYTRYSHKSVEEWLKIYKVEHEYENNFLYKDSCGCLIEKVGKVLRSRAIGKAADDWNKIKQAIEHEFAENLDEIYRQSSLRLDLSLFCWMLGTSELNSVPCAIIGYYSEDVAFRAAKVAKNYLTINDNDNYGFGVGYMKISYTDLAGKKLPTYKLDLADIDITKIGCLNACGVSLSIYDGTRALNRFSTIGGNIHLPLDSDSCTTNSSSWHNVHFQPGCRSLTVAHAFLDRPQEPPLKSPAVLPEPPLERSMSPEPFLRSSRTRRVTPRKSSTGSSRLPFKPSLSSESPLGSSTTPLNSVSHPGVSPEEQTVSTRDGSTPESLNVISASVDRSRKLSREPAVRSSLAQVPSSRSQELEDNKLLFRPLAIQPSIRNNIMGLRNSYLQAFKNMLPSLTFPSQPSKSQPFKGEYGCARGLTGQKNDWAVTTKSGLSSKGINRIDSRLLPDSPSGLSLITQFVTEISLQPPEGEVIIITRRGLLRGFGLGKTGSTDLRGPCVNTRTGEVLPMYSDQWAFEVLAGSKLIQGDSGSWVIDAESGKLFGILTSAIPTMGIGRILPARKIQYDLWYGHYWIPNTPSGRLFANKTRSGSVNNDKIYDDLYSKVDWCPFRLLPSLQEIYVTAAECGDVEVLEQVSIEILANDYDDGTYKYHAFSRACHMGHLEAAEYLLQNGADIHAKDVSGILYGRHRALFEAVRNEKYEIIELLLQHEADPNTEFDDSTALVTAVQTKNLKTIKLLAQTTIDINTNASWKLSLLKAAIDEKWEAGVEFIISVGANNNENYDNPTSPSWQYYMNGLEGVKLLIETDLSVREDA